MITPHRAMFAALPALRAPALNAIARRLNERPRETFGFETPAERFGPAACLVPAIFCLLRLEQVTAQKRPLNAYFYRLS